MFQGARSVGTTVIKGTGNEEESSRFEVILTAIRQGGR